MLLPVAGALLMGACSDEPLDRQETSKPSTVSFALSTADLEPASRSVSYNLRQTVISEGSLIGCIVAYAQGDGTYTYVANTAWTYTPQGLLLTRMYDDTNTEIDVKSYDNSVLRLKNPDADASDPARFDLELMPGHNYAFFFYYPYIDEKIVADELQTRKFDQYGNGSYAIKLKSLPYPNAKETDKDVNTISLPASDADMFNDYFLNSLPGAADIQNLPSGSGTFKRADWRKFPFCPMLDYRTDDPDDLSTLNNSDFMYAAVTSFNDKPINADNTKAAIPVTLRQQLAVIELAFAEEPEEVYLEPVVDQSTWIYTMPRIQDFDFVTGRFTGNHMAEYDRYGHSLIDMTAPYRSNIYPHYMGVSREWISSGWTDFHIYRLLMMPQTDVDCNVVMKIAGRELRLENLQRNPKLARLEGGTYYKIRFSPTGEETGWHLEIDDWQDGGGSLLERP